MRRSLPLLLVVFLLALALHAWAKERALRSQVLTVAMGGHVVGTTSARDVETNRGFRFERQSQLALSRGGVRLEIETRTVSETTRDLRPLSYRYEKQDASGTLVTVGRVEGGKLLLETRHGDSVVKNEVALPKDVLLGAAFEHLVRTQLQDGARFFRPVIVEELGAVVPMEAEVKAAPHGFTLTLRFAGLETVEKVNEAGETLLSETPGLGAIAYPKGAPPPGGLKGGEVDLLARSTWPAPRLPGSVERVRYRIFTPDAHAFVVPEDARQRVVGRTDRYVEVEVQAGLARQGALSAKERARLTRETPYEPTSDPRLKETAERVARGAKSTQEKVERLVRFVYEHVEEKGLDRGYVPALGTLESKKGDCTEHSVLLSALLRALGIPTRLVDGVVVSGGRAGYHEWVEVQIDDEGFVPADPTFGAFPAGPERLKLAEGDSGPEGLLRLGVAAGRLLRPGVRIEVVSSTPAWE